ncbi:MAG: FGGY family carbohydrate kinase [Chloroflexota bacterium]|nr:FGGY family carbohydrate kinase [Chloroflexota bacterium]
MTRESVLEVSRRTAERPLALAVDVGSSSIRAILYDRLGRAVRGCTARTDYRMSTSAGGGVEIDAGVLIGHVAQTLDRFSSIAGDMGGELAAVGVCCFSHSLVGLDHGGEVRSPVLSWADTTSAAEAHELRQALDQHDVWQRTGAPLHPGYWPARILRQRRRDRQISRWAGFGELLGAWLTGRHAASISMASTYGLLERRHDRWDDELLGVLGVAPAALPELRPDHLPLGVLVDELAVRWPSLAGVPWFPVWSDAACGNVGLACRGARRAALMIGTSSAMRVLLDGVEVDLMPGLFCFRLGERSTLLGGQLSEGGGTVAWLSQLTGRSADELEAAAALLSPAAHGIDMLPYLSGERGLGYHDRARGALAGLSLSSGPAELFRATLESLALRLAAIDRLLTRALGAPPAVVVAGGAVARSALLPGILADALGRPVELPRGAAEPSSRGAALLALYYSVGTPPDEAAPVSGKLIPFDAQVHQRYRAALQRQNDLYGMVAQRWRQD